MGADLRDRTSVRELIKQRLNGESSAFAELMVTEKRVNSACKAVKAGARLKYPRLIEPSKIKADRAFIPSYIKIGRVVAPESPVEMAVRNSKGFSKTPTMLSKLK